jgi:acyl carrier protein
MTTEEILGRMTDVFRDVLDNDAIELSRETTANDIEEWDSLAHINIIVAIEQEFSLRFDLIDIKPLRNIGEFVDLIERKTS